MAIKLYDKPLISNRNGAASLYSWSPNSNDKQVRSAGLGSSVNNVGCNLSEDYNVTYAYEILFTNGPDKHIPYVTCDYVE